MSETQRTAGPTHSRLLRPLVMTLISLSLGGGCCWRAGAGTGWRAGCWRGCTAHFWWAAACGPSSTPLT